MTVTSYLLIEPKLQCYLADDSIRVIEQVQGLWSGYGSIIRCYSKNKDLNYIVKYIQTSEPTTPHPRGWSGDTSHQRKVKSYKVEMTFYQQYAKQCNKLCKIPKLVETIELNNGHLLVMEDLYASGYQISAQRNDWGRLKIAIHWLANFHSIFMFSKTDRLWPQGSYWHLGTRGDELMKMPASIFKTEANNLDLMLRNAKYQTLIHGDAKFENLCFHTKYNSVAAVDFQYIGRGAGVIDLAYLVGSALDNSGLQEFGDRVLPLYINTLITACKHNGVNINVEQLCKEYSVLYPVAWADFYRFLLGWNPDSWKINSYMMKIANIGITLLNKSR